MPLVAVENPVIPFLPAEKVLMHRASAPLRFHPPFNNRVAISKLSVLIPVYNERWTINEIVARVLAVEFPIEVEIIAIDDCSKDGSWDMLQELARRDPRIKVFRQERNQGKGAAIRKAIEHMTGDVAVVQDADLEYDPRDIRAMLDPIINGHADAVFGSRYIGLPRRATHFWHTLVNRTLTLISNVFNGLNLTDMETCYKMVRADVLKELNLKSSTFTLEPEITSRLAQWGARVYEVPISYAGRTLEEGKKIRAIDGVKALWELFRCKFVDPQFSKDHEFYCSTTDARAKKYHRWVFEHIRPYLGQDVLQTAAGVGSISGLLLDRSRVHLLSNKPLSLRTLSQRFGRRINVEVYEADSDRSATYEQFEDQQLDTIICSEVLENSTTDQQLLADFERTLAPGGHCIVMAPAGRWLFCALDVELGRRRRYSKEELIYKLEAAGFEVVDSKQFGRAEALVWLVRGKLLGARYCSPSQTKWFDRFLPLVRALEGLLPLPGATLVVVGRKQGAAPARLAA